MFVKEHSFVLFIEHDIANQSKPFVIWVKRKLSIHFCRRIAKRLRKIKDNNNNNKPKTLARSSKAAATATRSPTRTWRSCWSPDSRRNWRNKRKSSRSRGNVRTRAGFNNPIFPNKANVSFQTITNQTFYKCDQRLFLYQKMMYKYK